MSFIYSPSTVKDAIKNEGKFNDNKKDLHKTIVLGDERSTMFPQLYALSIVWIKFHNLVVDEIKKHHQDLKPEDLFFEARRFVLAVYQNVIYNEALLMLLSSRSYEKLQDTEGVSCYDPNLDPSVSVEFTASAGRFYHTNIQNGYIISFKNGTKSEILLRDLNDESIGFDELSGVITGGLDRAWNSMDIAKEVKYLIHNVRTFL